jgi:hypothetical protein
MSQLNAPTFQLIYNGIDVTKQFKPYIKKITYVDFLQDECDQLAIEILDFDRLFSNLWYPTKGAKISCSFIHGNEILNCGKFTISQNNFKFSSFGDTLTINAFAIPDNAKLDTIHTDYYEKTSLISIAKTIADKHNLNLLTNNLSDFIIERINQINETDMAFLNRISKKYGYIFKITDNNLTFTKIDNLIPNFSLNRSSIRNLSINDDGIKKYKGCIINYFNPQQKKMMTAKQGDTSGDILYLDEKFYSTEEGEIIAKAVLDNMKEITGSLLLKKPIANFISGMCFNLSDFGFFNGIYQINNSVHVLSNKGWDVYGNFSKN